MNAIDEFIRSLARTEPLRPQPDPAPRERQPGTEPDQHRAARAIFRKWLALRHRGIHLGAPLTDPLPAPYGGWYRVYRHGRVYWHCDPRMDARLGTFHRRAA
jgi:hypothetical protein